MANQYDEAALFAALSAQGAPQWHPVISALFERSAGWPERFHLQEGDPDFEEILSLIKSESFDASDFEVALLLSETSLARRAAVSGPLRWSVFDEELTYREMVDRFGNVTPILSTTPSTRIAHELLGWCVWNTHRLDPYWCPCGCGKSSVSS